MGGGLVIFIEYSNQNLLTAFGLEDEWREAKNINNPVGCSAGWQ
jgi:hypothetical protein